MKAFLFDMDGVLVDTELEYFEAALKVLEQYNKNIKLEDIEHLAGATTEDFWWELKNIVDLDVPITGLVEACSTLYLDHIKNISPLPGVVDFLKAIQGKVRSAIVTNARRQSKNQIMQTTGIAKYFDNIFTKEDYPEPKPSPKAYLFAAEQLGIKPEDCMVFEDSLRGASAAKKAGMYTVVMPKGVTAGQDFSFADKKVKGFNELNVEELLAL